MLRTGHALAVAVAFGAVARAGAQSIEVVSVADDGTVANGLCDGPTISDDGSRVAFRSRADNLVAGDTNRRADVFLRDRAAGTTVRLSVSDDGTQRFRRSNSPCISADGSAVAFSTDAPLLGRRTPFRQVVLHDVATGILTAVSVRNSGRPGNGDSDRPRLSADRTRATTSSPARNPIRSRPGSASPTTSAKATA